MKGGNLFLRLGNALKGLRHAVNSERSLRTHLLAAVTVMVAAMLIRPGALWLALLGVVVAMVIACELLNTALEAALDGLHPDRADFVRISKDCAASSVLILSMASVLVFFLMVMDALWG